MSTSSDENILLPETNKGRYKLDIVAKFSERFPVQYVIRVSNPKGTSINFVSTLEGFKRIGDLLIDLHQFAQTKLYSKDTAKLREILTAENIKRFVKLREAGEFRE